MTSQGEMNFDVSDKLNCSDIHPDNTLNNSFFSVIFLHPNEQTKYHFEYVLKFNFNNLYIKTIWVANLNLMLILFLHPKSHYGTVGNVDGNKNSQNQILIT